MASRPKVVAFNVIETMFSLDNVRHKMQDEGLPASSLELWFARIVRDGEAMTLAGAFKPFTEIAQGELEVLLDQYSIEPTTSRVASIMQGFMELDAQPDAERAMRMLDDAGMKMVAITNGSVKNTQGNLERAGLQDYISIIYSIDEIRYWKPHPAIYEYTAQNEGVEPEEMALVAVHAWDIAGAKRAGFTTGWANRLEKRFSSAMGQPDVSGATLTEVVEAMLKLPQQSRAAAELRHAL